MSMRGFNRWLNMYMPRVADWADHVDYRQSSPEVKPSLSITAQMARVIDGMNPKDERAKESIEASVYSVWAYAGFLKDGIKLYAPTVTEAEGLSRVTLEVPCHTYRQPFGTFAVVLPEGFDAGRVEEGDGVVQAVVGRLSHGEAGKRLLCMRLATTDGDTETGFDYTLPMSEDDPTTIEEYVMGDGDDRTIKNDTWRRLYRIFVNSCMLLTHYGAHKLGSTNPEFEAKLTQKLKRKDLPDSARRANEKALKSIPVVYGIHQDIRVYQREYDGSTGPGRPGHEVRSHWRRGHWAHQPHGPKQSLRKLVFRPAVLVHADRFAGVAADTRVTYHTS
jgi:hypothetical protein